MDKTEFFKCLGTMRTIFEAVSTAASSLMEMNAMNVSPTQEESAQLREAFGDIRDRLYQLKAESQEKIQEYNARKEESAITAEAAIGEYTRMQENLVQLEKANGEAKVALAQKSAEKDEIQRACRKSEADLEDVRCRRDEEVRKSRKKAEDLKKWFWVPGYGIYLAVGALINELDNEIGSLSRRLEKERQRQSELSEQYGQICREVEERNQKIEMTRARMTDQNRQIEQQGATIDMYKKQLLYWEDFHMQISKLESRFKAGGSSPEMMYELIELMEAFEDAAEK